MTINELECLKEFNARRDSVLRDKLFQSEMVWRIERRVKLGGVGTQLFHLDWVSMSAVCSYMNTNEEGDARLFIG